MMQFRVDAEEKQRSVHYFQSQSDAYHRSVEKGLLKHLRARERGVILDLAGFRGGSARTMIDLGCGTGIYALAARAAGLHVTAVDISPRAIDQLQGRVDVAVVGDVEHLVSGTYDVVVCSGVLDYVSDPRLALGNLCRLVAPKGRLVLQTPRAGIGGRVHAFLVRRKDGLRVNLFTLKWLVREAGLCGLELARWRYPLPHNLAATFTRPNNPEVAGGVP